MTDDLLTLLREHDLPPRWDGLAVVWDDWVIPAPAFICPPSRPSCCEGCGSMTQAVTSRGRVARVQAVTHDALAENDAARDRLPERERWRVRPKALLRLHAFRCPECRLDTVWDTETGEWWTLDHTDYGDDGSVG